MRRVEQKPPHLAGQVMSFQPKLRFRKRTMDKDRVVGSAKKIKGSLKEVVGSRSRREKALKSSMVLLLSPEQRSQAGFAHWPQGARLPNCSACSSFGLTFVYVADLRREPIMAASVVSCGSSARRAPSQSDNCQTN
jgi:hypothetical protein